MPLLQVENLSKTFDEPAKLFGSEQFYAVKDVSFTLNRKETLAIIGKNGSGKSTLLFELARLTDYANKEYIYENEKFPCTERLLLFRTALRLSSAHPETSPLHRQVFPDMLLL